MCNVFDQVADFGESKQFVTLKTNTSEDDLEDSNKNDGLLTMTFVGTELYMAPEIFDGQRYNKSVDASTRNLDFLLSLLHNFRKIHASSLSSQVFAFSLVLLELALGDPVHVKNNHREKGQTAYAMVRTLSSKPHLLTSLRLRKV